MTVGERLKELRNKKDLSQQELSNRIGIRRATYARYETDANQADYETLLKLAAFFNVTTDYILTGKSQLEYKHYDPELLQLIKDPEVHTAFKEIPGSNEQVKDELLDILRFLKYKERYRDSEDKGEK
ncbi:helix-turn-helix domain-containing protein [Tuberibacillus sp. Marseille-P3662]|uniref:helix-turn-helix domain-containing protein n=1 Tax=Tuberibacillus sp. Marseille-P3662 TaxID=1965358 RepID=UPI001593A72F|nr:helix-turn-helix transcriptional regulator [Tuberibacillus sp. Marseille-P3662]